MNELGQKKKVDITLKVTGKIMEDQLLLYVDDRKIGQMSLQGTDQLFSFEPTFGIENHKVYQIQEVGVEDDTYVEGCDLGWC